MGISIILRCVDLLSRIKNVLMEMLVSLLIRLFRNIIICRNIRNSFARIFRILFINVLMEIFVRMLIANRKYFLHSFIITLKMKIFTYFSIKLNSVLSILPSTTNQNVFMLIIGRITEESQIFITTSQSYNLYNLGLF